MTEKTREELLIENKELKLRLLEAEETLNAIQSGEVDALIIDSSEGAQTFTLRGADYIYRVLIEQMNQGVAILTPDLTIYYCNGQLASMLKVPLELMMGRKITDFIPKNKLKHFFEKQCSIESCKEETILKASDGTILPIELSNQFLEDVDSIYIIITDLSYYKQAEQELKELVGNLRRSNEELEQFAYISSHDLQEPLRTIASFTQLLERRYKGKLDKDADEFMDYIVDAAVRMKQQIQDLLEYSRVTTKGNEFKRVHTDYILNEVINSLKNIIDETNAKITHDPLPDVVADSDQLRRVFQNLIGNAIKFRKPHEPPRIHISAKKDDEKNEYVFSVADNGIGIEEQYLGRIFKIFKRLHTIDEYNGTGIGLAVVKRVIEWHKGRIWAESQYGVGSTFYFTLPIMND